MIEKEWYDWFRDTYAVENDVIMPLSRGEITPAAGVEAVTPKVEAIIKDTLGK